MSEKKRRKLMSEEIQRETAKIIRFPVERRAGGTGAQSVGRRVVERPVVATIESGSGWYHDAAIQDAGQARHR
jgi:hypothetical protein